MNILFIRDILYCISQYLNKDDILSLRLVNKTINRIVSLYIDYVYKANINVFNIFPNVKQIRNLYINNEYELLYILPKIINIKCIININKIIDYTDIIDFMKKNSVKFNFHINCPEYNMCITQSCSSFYRISKSTKCNYLYPLLIYYYNDNICVNIYVNKNSSNILKIKTKEYIYHLNDETYICFNIFKAIKYTSYINFVWYDISKIDAFINTMDKCIEILKLRNVYNTKAKGYIDFPFTTNQQDEIKTIYPNIETSLNLALLS